MSEDKTKEEAQQEKETAKPEETAPEAAKEESTEETKQEAEEKAPAKSAEMPYKAKLIDFERLAPGQTVRLHERIKDVSPKGEERERIQVFEGIILAMGGSGIARTITLQKNSGGVMVEKIYPINSPVVAKIELVKVAKVRRAKLNYLRHEKKRFKRKLQETHVDTNNGKKKKKKKSK